MSSILDTLKSHIRSYTKIDDELQTINKKVYEMRNERREIESNIAQILQTPELSQIDKIQLSEDNSVLKIQRPGWNKPWSLSKKELKTTIDSYFQSTTHPTADGCYSFVLDSTKDKLVSTDFNFTRVKNE